MSINETEKTLVIFLQDIICFYKLSSYSVKANSKYNKHYNCK